MPHNQAYLQAEKKIKEMFLTNREVLLLNSLELTELPESLAELSQLKFLDISRNLLTTLPEWLGNLTSLDRLIISNNKLSTLP